MRTVVALVALALLIGAVVHACQPAPTYHLTPSQCAALVADGTLMPDANGVVTCP